MQRPLKTLPTLGIRVYIDLCLLDHTRLGQNWTPRAPSIQRIVKCLYMKCTYLIHEDVSTEGEVGGDAKMRS